VRLLERAIDGLLGRGDGWGALPSARTRTAIVVAHRLATVQRADEIMILGGGRVVEHGPRAALAADPRSHFSSLLRVGLEAALA
jgi:ABC-type multidrug transport system fused ATPase/permease subunit